MWFVNMLLHDKYIYIYIYVILMYETHAFELRIHELHFNG